MHAIPLNSLKLSTRFVFNCCFYLSWQVIGQYSLLRMFRIVSVNFFISSTQQVAKVVLVAYFFCFISLLFFQMFPSHLSCLLVFNCYTFHSLPLITYLEYLNFQIVCLVMSYTYYFFH